MFKLAVRSFTSDSVSNSMENLSLFDELPAAAATEPSVPVMRSRLGPKLADMAAQRLFIGTSSWKYEGWLGQIYTAERYQVKGRFAKKRFESECLSEYAETFPVVCGDFSFYQFPAAEFWSKLFQTAPSKLQFALKVPEEITVCSFPQHPRYGSRAGQRNPTFLNADLFEAEFLRLLQPYCDRVAVIIFEFGTLPAYPYPSLDSLLDPLARLMSRLPRQFRYAVEIRNPEFICPDYFAFLSDANVAHVFNSWTRMPSMSSQLSLPEASTTNFTVARALLKPGRRYEEAVQMFAPYTMVQEPNHEVREALRTLLVRAKQREEATYIFVNNRLEGNAPGTIESIIADW